MKNYFLFISIILFSFQACNEKEQETLYFKKISKILKKYNSERIQDIIQRYPSNYKNNEYYKAFYKIDSISNMTINGLRTYGYKENIVNSYISNIQMLNENIYNDYQDIKPDIQYLIESINENHNISILISRILLIENIIGNHIFMIITNKSFQFDMISPVVIPKKSPIKLGETFYAQIYLAAVQTENRHIAIIENDTIAYSNDNNLIPLYKTKPNERGKYIKKGVLLVYRNKQGEYFPYEFEIHFTVE